MNIKFPRQNYCKINIIVDTSAQSCLWDLDNYLNMVLKKSQILYQLKENGSSQQRTDQNNWGFFYEVDGLRCLR